MIKAVFFDLDGTLLPLDEKKFIDVYFKLLCRRMVDYGFEPNLLSKVIWEGTMAMFKNDGSVSNEEVFWDLFEKYYGKEKRLNKEIFDEFYTNEFKQVKVCCEENEKAKNIIDFCHKNNLITVLSTNPLFPRPGTLTRMSFIGLKEEDFDYVTTYENSRYCKPNPKYFIELLNKYNLKPEEVIVFGNNTLEDGECSLACGMKCYIVGDKYVIEHEKTIHEFERISMDDIITKIEENLN